MIIILKIILAMFIAIASSVIKFLFKDFKETVKTEEFEEITIADKIKIKLMFYISIVALISFCILLGYFIFVPIAIV